MRDAFPDRFFDTGICESHAVAFAAGQAKAGLRPIVDIYSTFLQRSYDQIFQEVALQNLPVTFLLDRAGLTGPDGPTHHGVFDLGYMRLFPNMVVMAPGDEDDLRGDARFRPGARRPGVDPLSEGDGRERRRAQRRRSSWAGPKCSTGGHDGMIIACGTLLGDCVKAAATLRDEGLDVGVINARFVKPLDTETILRAVETAPFVVTVEEGGAGGRIRQRRAGSGRRRRPERRARPPPGHSRSLHRARRARRTAGRPGPRRRRHRRKPAAAWPARPAATTGAARRHVI